MPLEEQTKPPFADLNKPSQAVAVQGDSQIGNVTVRGWIVIMLDLTVCVMAFTGHDVKEPLYSMVVAANAFYFGQKTSPKNTQ